VDLRTLLAALSPERPILTVEEEDTVVSFEAESFLQEGGFLAVDEFACHSAACAPPSAGGTGGSIGKGGGKSGGVAHGGGGSGAKPSSDKDLDLLYPGRRDAGNKKVNPDGTFSVEGLDEHGNPTKFSAKTEAKVRAEWDAIGPTDEQYVKNFEIAGELAMGINPRTGAVDAEQAAQGHHDSKWYTVAHQDCQDIAKATGIDLDNVVAATAALSAGRLWSGTANGNIETARALANIVRNPIDIEVTQAHIDMMNWRAQKSTKGVGKVGLVDHGLTPGKINSNDLDSGTLTELLYAANTVRGHASFQEWYDQSSKDGKPGMRSTKTQIETPPPYPFFTSKGTQQVKQAVAVLRNEVTPRQAISGPKYSSFYSNIRNPDADYSSTNDTWHYRIMAGNLPLHVSAKGIDTTDTIDRLTMKERSPNGIAPTTAQDIFQRGPASKSEGIKSGDAMFRDTTVLTRQALDRLAAKYPAQFKGMKPHEFQALIWVHYGGGQASKGDRLERWDSARAAMKEAGL